MDDAVTKDWVVVLKIHSSAGFDPREYDAAWWKEAVFGRLGFEYETVELWSVREAK
jgi:hypothetical protein